MRRYLTAVLTAAMLVGLLPLQVLAGTAQAITFTSTAPAGAVVGGATYDVTATADSGLTVAFSIDIASAGACTLSGSTVSFVHAGTCVIDADQPGDATFDPAPQVQQTFSVGKGDQAIAFTSTEPAAARVGGTGYAVTATGGGSANAVTFTIDASASSVCSIAAGTVSFDHVGTCVVNADQAGDADWNAAPQAQQTFAVGKGTQAINFTSTAPVAAVVGGPTYTVTATGGGSGNAVTLTIAAPSASVCTIAGSTVSFTGVGTCTIDANQAGDADYSAAPQAQQAFAVGKGGQSIAFTSSAPGAAVVGGATYTVTATGGPSGNPVTFTIDASSSGRCTILAGTVTMVHAGSCTIDANQAGDADYDAAPQAQQAFTIGKGAQAITFTSTAPVSAVVGGSTYTVTATGGTSGNAVTFTIAAPSAAICTIAGSVVSFIATGTCTIDADQAGNGDWNAATQAQQAFAVGKGTQTISFSSTAPVAAVVGGSTYTVTATATSGLAVTRTIDPASASVCSIAGSTVSFLATGTCTIDANQAGDANWNAATQVQQSFAVGKGTQTITITSSAPGAAVVGGSTYTVTATATSALPVTFTIDAASAAVCSIAGGIVSFTGVGTCTVDANQAGNANWNPATQVQQSFAVGKGTQTILFTSTAPVSAVVGGSTYTVTATGGGSGNAVTFTIAAPSAAVCSITGSTVSFTAVGTCTVNANQAGNANWNAATQVQQSFAVGKGTQVITFTSTAPSSAVVGGSTYPVTATATSGLAVTLTIDAVSAGDCTLSAGVVTMVHAGSCTIDANQGGNANWNAATQAQQSFTIGKGTQTILFTSAAPGSAVVGGVSYHVFTSGGPSGNAVTLSIDATSAGACTLSGPNVNMIHAGTCVVDANQAGNADWNAATQAQQSFTIGKGTQVVAITSTAPSSAVVAGPTYTVSATGGASSSPVILSIDAASSGRCTISGSVVSMVHAGSCTVDVNQAGDADWNAALQVQQTFTIGKGSQTVVFTSTAPVGAVVAGSPYLVTATGGPSGSAIVITIAPASSAVCSIAGSTVSFTGAGTCAIDANQAGNADWNAASQVVQSFAVGKGSQTVAFSTTAPGSAVVAGSTYGVAATATSGLVTVISIDASSLGACTIAGATVSFVHAGTCTIDANQARQRQLEPGDPGPAVLCRRPGQPGDLVRHARAGRCRGRGPHLRRRRDRRRIGRAGHLHDRRRLGRRLHHRRSDGQLRPCRDLHHRRRPGGDRGLDGRAAGPAVLRRGPGRPGDRVHLDRPAGCRGQRRDVRPHGHRHERPRRDLHDRRRLGRRLHDCRSDGQLRPRRDLHHQRGPGRRCRLERRRPGPAELRRRQGRPGGLVHDHGTGFTHRHPDL